MSVVSKYRVILLTICPNLLSYKVLLGNMIYEMKVCLKIDAVFKLFENVVLANFHHKYSQKSKRNCYIFSLFFVFEENDHGMMFFMIPCIKYFNIMGFLQSKLKEFYTVYPF